jgi:hypothetical protein
MKSVVLTRRLHEAHLAFSSGEVTGGVEEEEAAAAEVAVVVREGDFEREEERERKDILCRVLGIREKKKMFEFSSSFFLILFLTFNTIGLLNPKRK